MTIQHLEETILEGISRATLETLSKEELISIALDVDRRNRRTYFAAHEMMGSHIYNMPRICALLDGRHPCP